MCQLDILRCARGLGGGLPWSSVKVWIGHLDAERYEASLWQACAMTFHARHCSCSNKGGSQNDDRSNMRPRFGENKGGRASAKML